MKKILFIIIDGLGDRPISQLRNKTPLEAAKTPNLDFLTKNGICGLVEPYLFSLQEKPESDISHLALFGYNPKIYYLGRGPYEAAGVGIKLREGDVALRVNFATVDENLEVIDRRAGRIEKTQPLIKTLSQIKIKGIKFILKKSYGHRAVLVLRSQRCLTPGVKHLSERISDGDPKKIGLKIKKIRPLDKTNDAKFTTKVLNEFLERAHSILKNHSENKRRIKNGLLPANYLLVRGAGILKKTPSFKEKYGLRACCIAGGALYKGIAKILGMDLLKVRGANGFPNTNLRGKILAAKNGLKKPAPYRNGVSGAGYNFIFLHIKAADSLAEDGNFLGKKEFIEKLDKNLKPIFKLNDVLIVVTGDHSTCSILKRHCKIPIPILISGLQPTRHPPASRAPERDKIEKFSEKSCEKGKLGKIKQINLMKKILKYVRGIY